MYYFNEFRTYDKFWLKMLKIILSKFINQLVFRIDDNIQGWAKVKVQKWKKLKFTKIITFIYFNKIKENVSQNMFKILSTYFDALHILFILRWRWLFDSGSSLMKYIFRLHTLTFVHLCIFISLFTNGMYPLNTNR